MFGSDVDCLRCGKKYFRIGFDIAQFGGRECVINALRDTETAKNWFKVEGNIGNNRGGDSMCAQCVEDGKGVRIDEPGVNYRRIEGRSQRFVAKVEQKPGKDFLVCRLAEIPLVVGVFNPGKLDN